MTSEARSELNARRAEQVGREALRGSNDCISFLARNLLPPVETGLSEVRAKMSFEAGSNQFFRKDRLGLLRSLIIWLNAKLIPFQT